MDIYEKIALAILIIGGLHLGIIGLFGVSIIGMLGKLSDVVYVVFGLSALYVSYCWVKDSISRRSS